MTTVAFDGEILACDSQSTGPYCDTIIKVVRFEDAFIGFSGTVSEFELFKRWFIHKKKKPEVKDINVLVIRQNEAWYYDENLARLPSTIPVAIGSGAPFAMGAMLAGAGAKKAVKIARKLDEHTGGKIHTYEVNRF